PGEGCRAGHRRQHAAPHRGRTNRKSDQGAPASVRPPDGARVPRVSEEPATRWGAATADRRPSLGSDVQGPVADEYLGPVASNLGEERSVQPRAVPRRQSRDPLMNASGETERLEVSDPKLDASA